MTGNTGFEKLLEPYHIGKVKTRNRIVKTGAGMGSAVASRISSKTIAFYEALARGGVGLLIVESPCIDPPFGDDVFRFDDDKYIPDFSKLVGIIHKYGCPTFLELFHTGPNLPEISGPPPGSASQGASPPPMPEGPAKMPDTSIPDEVMIKGIRAYTIPQIEGLVDRFASAAVRAQKAGFDGVDINGGAGHLINSFLSRVINTRQDAYGNQSLENRSRLMVQIITEIKKRTGTDFPVTAIINGAEFGIEKGTTIEEAQGFARIIEAAGADGFQIRAFGYGDYQYHRTLWPENLFYPEPSRPFPQGLDSHHEGFGVTVPLASAIKQVVSVPVITIGRQDPALGNEIIRQGKVDFIGFTRRLLADPDLPNKIAAGKLEDIAPCTACLHCHTPMYATKCRVNAALGGEKDYHIQPAEKKKRVVVVGGGPAGMEAARVAAARGHEVILYEKEPNLGGLLPIAALVKGTEIEDLPALVRYLKTQITKLGVKINLGKEFTPQMLDEIKPDAVILATGGVPDIKDLPGIKGRNVIILTNLDKLLRPLLRLWGPKFMDWLTKIWMPGGRRVIVIGGTYYGCELAEFLVKRGRAVTIVESGIAEKLGDGMPADRKQDCLDWLTKKGVKMVTEVKNEKITDKGLVVITKEGRQQLIEADTIMPSTVLRPNSELLKSLEGKVSEVYAVGDCSDPRMIIDAIADGYRAAWSV
jgi:2,4-dienoyl-CoA reductase (NADPH2)